MWNLVVIVAGLVIVALVATMVLWSAYPDHLVGKAALCALGLGAGAPIYEVLAHDVEYEWLRTTALFYLGVALFMAWHFCRFLRFRRKERRRAARE